MTATQTGSIFDQMAAGAFDAQLEALAQAIQARRKYLAQQQGLANKAEFGPGTKVAIVGAIRPKYLIGITGTVSTRPARRAGDIQLDVDERWRFQMGRYGMSVGVPGSCLQRAA